MGVNKKYSLPIGEDFSKDKKIQEKIDMMKERMNKLERGMVYYRLFTPQDISLQTEKEFDYYLDILNTPLLGRAYDSAMRKMAQIIIDSNLKDYKSLKPYLEKSFLGIHVITKQKEK